MGLILIPLFLAMSVGFSYVGIRTGIQAVSAARGRATAILALVIMSAGLSTLALLLPFAVASVTSVSAGGFTVLTIVCVCVVAAWAGTSLAGRFRKKGRPMDGLGAAAFFLAAGSFPVTWFWLGERLGRWLQIQWVY